MSTPPAVRPPFGTTTNERIPDKSPNRAPAVATTGQGLVRHPSLRSSRPIRKPQFRTSTSSEMQMEDDARAANAQLISDLREQVERAEQASELYRRQLEAMQGRFDEVAYETTAAEEREFQYRTQLDKLQADLRDSARQNRDLEMSFESDKKLILQERDRYAARGAELQSVVGRLTETLKFKTQELNSNNRRESSQGYAGTDHAAHDADTDSGQDYLRILQEKDQTINELRLELADFHVKTAEQAHLGDAGIQALEKEIMGVKMQNARLQEENESFQMLLSERMLKGDFASDTAPANSLAEELQSVEDSEITPEMYRTMETENKNLRDSNKALTLYVDKIIGRLLQHEGFEHIITGKDDDSDHVPELTQKDKVLPQVPVEKPQPALPTDTASAPTPTSTSVAAVQSAAAGFLQRARSVVARPSPTPKVRPTSYMAPPTSSALENPQSAPSIPIARGHRRSRSDQAQDLGAAVVVAQMNRGSPLRTVSGGPMSPGISPLSPVSSYRASYFGPVLSANNSLTPNSSNTTSSHLRASSGSEVLTNTNKRDSSSNSIVSDRSLEHEAGSNGGSSARASMYGAPPASTATSTTTSNTGTIPGAVMKQNQLRPLRLVQEQAQADEEAQKKANMEAKRGSWMGWFKAGAAVDTGGAGQGTR